MGLSEVMQSWRRLCTSSVSRKRPLFDIGGPMLSFPPCWWRRERGMFSSTTIMASSVTPWLSIVTHALTMRGARKKNPFSGTSQYFVLMPWMSFYFCCECRYMFYPKNFGVIASYLPNKVSLMPLLASISPIPPSSPHPSSLPPLSSSTLPPSLPPRALLIACNTTTSPKRGKNSSTLSARPIWSGRSHLWSRQVSPTPNSPPLLSPLFPSLCFLPSSQRQRRICLPRTRMEFFIQVMCSVCWTGILLALIMALDLSIRSVGLHFWVVLNGHTLYLNGSPYLIMRNP